MRCRVDAEGLYRSGKYHCTEAVMEVVSGAEKIREGGRAGKMKTILAATSLLFLWFSAASADTFRCPNGAIVSTGDRIGEVYVKCDPPSFRDTRTESESGHRGATILDNVEEWTYNEGPHRLIHLLVFNNGILTEVRSLGFGK